MGRSYQNKREVKFMARTIEDIEQDICDAKQDVENSRSMLAKYPDYKQEEGLAILQQRTKRLQQLKSELEAAERKN